MVQHEEHEGSRASVSDRARALIGMLDIRSDEEMIAQADALLFSLRDARAFDLLCELAERICAVSRGHWTAMRLLVQGLLEQGHYTAAIATAKLALADATCTDSERDEFLGLVGRCYKQQFVRFPHVSKEARQVLLQSAWDAYHEPFIRHAENYWHGINLVALAHAARRCGFDFGWPAVDALASQVLRTLDAMDEGQRNHYWYATRAEAHVALKRWDDAVADLNAYARHPDSSAFSFASTLRQLRELWAVADDHEGLALLRGYESQLLQAWPKFETSALTLGASHIRALSQPIAGMENAFQKAYGPQGTETVDWYRMGLERAGAVAAFDEYLGVRFGTGFAIRASDICTAWGDEILVLTNFHVFNRGGLGGDGRMDVVQVKFEALVGGAREFEVDTVLAESPSDNSGLDYALVRLKGDTTVIKPVRLSITTLQKDARVYVIGYPYAQVMQISLHGGKLLDHECAPTGLPPVPERRRLHYSAVTEQGSSGSPVFNEKWECIGLHHAGGKKDLAAGKMGLPALNGGARMTEHNQGIWIGSIIEHVKSLVCP